MRKVEVIDLDDLYNQADQYEEMGDYMAAFRTFDLLAINGHGASMGRLANMYDSGNGVRRSYRKAVF